MLLATRGGVLVSKFNPAHVPAGSATGGQFAHGGGGGLPLRSGISAEPFDAASTVTHAGVYFTAPNGETISEKGNYSGHFGGPQHENLVRDNFVGYSKETPSETEVRAITAQKGLLAVRNFQGVTVEHVTVRYGTSFDEAKGEMLVTVGKEHLGLHRDRILSILDLAPQMSLTIVNKKGNEVKNFFAETRWGQVAVASHARRIETYLNAH